MKLFLKFNKPESWLFFIITLLTCTPIIQNQWFITHDGPAHLYNVRIIADLFEHDDSFFSSFFSLNPALIPNLSSHYILLFFSSVFGFVLGHKLFLISIIFFIVYGFREIVKALNKEAIWGAYLIFPFVFNFSFFMGFYNFMIGLACVFWGIKSQLNPKNQKGSLAYLFLFLSLSWFSHIMSFLFLFAAVFFIKLIETLIKPYPKGFAVHLFPRIIYLILFSIPYWFLSYLFISSKPEQINDADFISPKILLKQLLELDALVGLNSVVEGPTLKFLGIVLIGFFILSFIIRLPASPLKLLHFYGKKLPSLIRHLVQNSDSFLFLFLFSLLLYFIMPNGDSWAGYVSSRLALMALIFLTLWISTQPIFKWLGILVSIILQFGHFKLLRYYNEESQKSSTFAEKIHFLNDVIPPKSSVMVFNYSDHWLHKHLTNLISVGKNEILDLNNYEAGTGYFPVIKNEKDFPNFSLGSIPYNNSCFYWLNGRNKEAVPEQMDYVLIFRPQLQKQDSCNLNLNLILTEEFELSKKDDDYLLYKSRNQ